MHNTKLSSATWVRLLLVAGAAAAFLPQAGASQAQQPVGQVTFIIGKPALADATGFSQQLVRGAWVRPGDVINTAEGAHVHVRFTDGALVSVRPGSRLVIQEYQFHPENPKLTTVKFRLDSGTARAISGAAAEAAKQRFRLNTPLVAIGVRGTDFVVSTQGEITTASVNHGAIVMAPFAEGCKAADLGPCGSTGARLISADMGNVLAEYTAGLAQPVIKGTQDTGGVHTVASNGAASAQGRRSQGLQAQADVVVGKDTSAPELVSAANSNGAVASGVLAELVNAANTVPEPPPLPPQPLQPQQPQQPAALVWGRWAASASADDFSVHFLEARAGRNVTLGLDPFVLYRAPGTFDQSATGAASFRLNAGFAQYSPLVGPGQSAVVSNGELSIQFGTRDFTTQLKLQASSMASQQLTASGKLDSDGFFRSLAPGQTVLGAVAFDAQSAGYAFEKAVETGVFKGITLWSR